MRTPRGPPSPHLDEEDRGKKFHQGTEPFFEVMDVPLPELPEMDRLEDEPRGERPHDRRQARHPARWDSRKQNASETPIRTPAPAGAPRPQRGAG